MWFSNIRFTWALFLLAKKAIKLTLFVHVVQYLMRAGEPLEDQYCRSHKYLKNFGRNHHSSFGSPITSISEIFHFKMKLSLAFLFALLALLCSVHYSSAASAAIADNSELQERLEHISAEQKPVDGNWDDDDEDDDKATDLLKAEDDDDDEDEEDETDLESLDARANKRRNRRNRKNGLKTRRNRRNRLNRRKNRKQRKNRKNRKQRKNRKNRKQRRNRKNRSNRRRRVQRRRRVVRRNKNRSG